MTTHTLQEFFATSAEYADEETIEAIEQLSEYEWEAAKDATYKLIDADPADDDEGSEMPGMSCSCTITETTLDDFKHAQLKFWREKGSCEELTIREFNALHFQGVQPGKGQPRYDMIVLDLGEKRLCLLVP